MVGDRSDPRTPLARSLRSRATRAERAMWRILRQLPVQGTHFRRQVPIDGHVVDFALLRARLVIEVDGDVHAHSAASKRDAACARSITAAGFHLRRFTNSDVLRNPSGVAEVILAALASSAPPVDEKNSKLISEEGPDR